MGKKDFKGGLDSLLSGSKPKPSTDKADTKTTGTVKARTGPLKAATFKYSEQHLEKLRVLAFNQKRLIQDVLAEALEDVFKKHEGQWGKR